MKTTSNLRIPLACAAALTALLAVAGWAVFSFRAHAGDAADQAVLAAHEARRVATLGSDIATLGTMMTDDLTFTHANAVVETKGEFLDARKSGRLRYRSITDEDRRVRVHGGTGIVSGTCRIVVVASGPEIDILVRFTELWVKEDGSWRMPLWHATPVP